MIVDFSVVVLQNPAYNHLIIAELGEFIGTIIAGIYQGIRSGAFDKSSDFTSAAGREHISWNDYFQQIR